MLEKEIKKIDNKLIHQMHCWGPRVLRVSLAMVFIWFGLLKVYGLSPVVDLIKDVYFFLPPGWAVVSIGLLEIIIGFGLLFKINMHITIVLLWLQMIGVFFSLILSPLLFFEGGNLLMLTLYGEFVIKNLVLISASMMLYGYDRVC